MIPVSNPLPAATWRDYVAIARPDHWLKHVFIVPGIALAYILHPGDWQNLVVPVILGFLSAAAIASANYVINEWLDAKYDRFHPKKSKRPAVAKRLRVSLVIGEYAVLLAVGFGLAIAVSPLFFYTSFAFLLSGIFYNVAPVRTKDLPYLDVASEALNNPIRLTLGWAMVDPTTLPPSSLLLAYWMGGAFLMAIKRLAEYRSVAATSGVDALGQYRRSFRFYTADRLLISSFLYSQLAAFFLAVFLIKYRVEYLLAIPLFALLFTSYLRVGLKEHSLAQEPEKLFRETTVMILVAALVVTLVILTVVDIPLLERLTYPHYIELPPEPPPAP